MAEIKFTELNCQRCGGALEQKGDTYVCRNCGKMWQKETLHDFTDMLEACDQALRAQRVADIANLRQLLWEQTHREFVSNFVVERLCNDIQKYLPQDFYANFYIATCSRDKTELGDFLYNVNLREHYEDIPLVIEYLLKSLKPEWVLGVSNFIEKIKDIDTALYFKYRTQFEEEYAKVEDGVFEADLKRDVFIAYSSKDMPKVMELVAALEEENIYCFVAARNMRHGSGSVENYRNLLHTAIENCTVFVFVSSDNSRSFNCDAYREEISYINQHRKDMPRVEYLIQNYSGRAVERNFKDFFSGLEYCLSPQSVAGRVIDILMNSLQTEEEPSVVETPKVIEVSETIITNTTKPAALDPDELEKRLKRALSLMQAGEFEEAKKRLDKIESDIAAVTGECEVIEVYHYKLWADYAVTSDDGLVEKLIKEQADVTKNKNYILAMGFAEETKDEAWLNALNSIKVKAQNGIAEAKNILLSLGNYRDIGRGYITFGAYPQSRKAGNVQICGIYDKGRGYYLGSDNSFYEKYDKEYYKVEPIKWKVLSKGDEWFIASDIILDADYFGPNIYSKSQIRKWLNGEFYKKAFTKSQMNIILTTSVDNSVASTGYKNNKYACDNSNDEIFLLSYKEVKQYYTSCPARKKKASDYAKAHGLYDDDNGNCVWWLRSPLNDSREYARCIGEDGTFYYYNVGDRTCGISPALKIKP